MVTTEELNNLWKLLKLTEEDEDGVASGDNKETKQSNEGRNWLVRKTSHQPPLQQGGHDGNSEKYMENKQRDAIFQEFDGNLRPEEYMFSTALFWVRVYDLPLGMRNKEMGLRIGQRLVNLLSVDESLARRG
ncbi:hypothetical protein DITRI_Ditri18aG0014400 [Diplodiscus trichospermus]